MARASATIRVLACAAACAWGTSGPAQLAESPLKSAAKALGFATDAGPPADFVIKSRPKGELDYIPIFQPPPEPARPALNAKELESLKGGLDSVQKRDDAIRQAFPPAAKAVAEQQAAQEKAKAKSPDAHQ